MRISSARVLQACLIIAFGAIVWAIGYFTGFSNYVFSCAAALWGFGVISFLMNMFNSDAPSKKLQAPTDLEQPQRSTASRPWRALFVTVGILIGLYLLGQKISHDIGQAFRF